MGAADEYLFRIVNELSRIPVLNSAMFYISNRLVLFTIAAIFTIWLLLKGYRRAIKIVLTVALAVGLGDLLTYRVLKPLFKRQRPCHALSGVILSDEGCGGEYGFPSNHATNSAIIATLLIFFDRSLVWVLLMPLLVGFSRVYLGKHYPSDVLGGYVWGTFLATVFFYLPRLLRRLGRAPPL